VEIRPAAGPSVWRGDEQVARDWILSLDAEDCAEIEGAAAMLLGRRLETVGAQDFRLPRVAPKLNAMAETLAQGAGFVMLRGLPSARMSPELVEIAYWGIGAHLGIGVSQSVA